MTDDLERARREAAELLGLEPDKLTPGDRLRCELISALRARPIAYIPVADRDQARVEPVYSAAAFLAGEILPAFSRPSRF